MTDIATISALPSACSVTVQDAVVHAAYNSDEAAQAAFEIIGGSRVVPAAEAAFRKGIAMTAKEELAGRLLALAEHLTHQPLTHADSVDLATIREAAAALTEAGAGEAKPVAWRRASKGENVFFDVTLAKDIAELWEHWGQTVEPLYASPPPVQPVVKALTEAGAGEAGLHGPYGWLNGHRALSEDSWTLESDPLENSDEYFAIPLYALVDPFKETGRDFSPPPVQLVVKARPIQLWPFEERPGPFADRLHKALRDLPSTLSAIRNVLIEEPPTLSGEYLAALTAPPSPAPGVTARCTTCGGTRMQENPSGHFQPCPMCSALQPAEQPDAKRKELLDRCWRLNTRAEAAEAEADRLRRGLVELRQHVALGARSSDIRRAIKVIDALLDKPGGE